MKKQKYYLNSQGEFVIEDYNRCKPFASFLPAIAGLHGKPLWTYYVNRGQLISTFGINNKDYSILEFQPANKAYRQTALQGFRTFFKIKDLESQKVIYHEPFQDNLSDRDEDITQKMIITSYDVRIEEVNEKLGIKTEVMYCTLPGENIASLIRSLKVTNISGKKYEIEIIDGLPAIIPYYLTNIDMKEMSNLRQAWMGVDNYRTIPFYRIKVLPYDTPETLFLEGGNFYINVSFENGETYYAPVIVDPYEVFGEKYDFAYPEKFIEKEFEFPEEQVTVGTTPCGFGYRSLVLENRDSHVSYTLIGSAGNFDMVKEFAVSKISETYIIDKIEENRNLIESLKNPVFTVSNSKKFDLYAGQSFLDNFLRGGYPVQVGEGKHTFYVYSRKHGDLEREYNFFQVDSTYYSQGNANFRDVNQNRRNDIVFFPEINDTDIKTFFNLIQLDGFNPLVLKGSRFYIEDSQRLDLLLDEYVKPDHRTEIKDYLGKAFTPGSFLEYMEYKKVELLKGSYAELLDKVLAISSKEDLADFQEGYWVDHWIYNNDLLEQYFSIYPDRIEDLLVKDCSYTYYDNYEVVMPREKKYVLTPNGVRQLGSVIRIREKEELIKSRETHPNMVRTENGKGDIYHCTLLSKIVMLLVNKIASLDPEGIGVEMEANKPGWCDALNGLPAILGSSINETAAIKRLALIVKDAVEKAGLSGSIKVYEEGYRFFSTINNLLSDITDDFEYWKKSYEIKEKYRQEVIFGISGNEAEIDIKEIVTFLDKLVNKVDKAIEKALNKDEGVYYTYFINEVTEYEILKDENGQELRDANGYPYVKALKFRQRPIPYFLEGPVHVLRMEKDADKAKKLFGAIKKTGLYDKKLDMYKVNDNIMDETKEIGRQNIFPRGWLENEAVFLHMEYKYFLEILRSGLYDEFFSECFMKTIPFLDPEVYGRSILENSSFIASTVHPDKRVHGRGFVSRLSGASAEFLTMWIYMTVGRKPFFINDEGQLCLELKPVIPNWLFTEEETRATLYENMESREIVFEKDTFAFMFLGNVLTVYHNPNRKDTYGKDAAKIERIVIHKDGQLINIEGGVIALPYSREIREGKIDRLDIYLA